MPMTTPSPSRPIPVGFGRTNGWFHAGSKRAAVLMCAPTGFEALCIRHSWNVFADMIAERGFNVLRFDYPGEGDALDRAPDESFVSAAQDSIRAAADWLEVTVGVDELHVVGFRLGATLAAKALDGRKIGSMVLLAPVANGKVYIRQVGMAARIVAELRPGLDAGPGEVNLCGFVTNAQDCTDISALRLKETPSARRLLLMPESDRDAPDGWSADKVLPFAGYGALMTTPTEAILPMADFAAAADWLGEDVTTDPANNRDLPPEAQLSAGSFKETHLRLGAAGQLAGVLCKPIGPVSRVCVHLLNAGANYHIGWARMSVDHARALASEGVASIRYDFSGVGDSVWYPEGPRPHIYADRHLDDAEEAIESMRARGYEHHVLSGLCAGAYVAFHVADRHKAVTGAISANAIRLVWHPDDTLEALSAEMVQPSSVYRDKFKSKTEWKRLLTGEISARRLAHVLARYSKKAGKRVAEALGYEPPISGEAKRIRQALQNAAQRGARITFLHAERDQSRDETERYFGPGAKFAARQPGVTLEDIAGADHELTPVFARDHLYRSILVLAK